LQTGSERHQDEDCEQLRKRDKQVLDVRFHKKTPFARR
jgi:hypothetical protein